LSFPELFSLSREYLLLGIIILIAIALLFIVAYFIVYKKIFNGKKTLPPKKLLLHAIFICYLTVIIGAVLLSRVSDYDHRSVNLWPLSLYIEAWRVFTAVAWRNLILNIIAFIPLGVLLPLLSGRLKRLWITVGAGCAFSVMIECIQYITARGQASTDDIINRTLGVLIGYGLVMAIFTIKDKEKRQPLKVLGYLSPLLGVAVAFGAFTIMYQIQRFGNLPGANFSTQDMTNIDVTHTVELSEEKSQATVYQTSSFNKTQSRDFAEGFFKRLGSSFALERKPIYYDESAYFYSDNNHILVVRYKGKTYKYTNFQANAEPDPSLSQEQVREMLSALDVRIPDGTEFFNSGDGSYSFTVNAAEADQQFIGDLSCEILRDGTVRKIDNNLLECESNFKNEIISPKEAFSRIAQGKFHYGSEYGKMQSVEVTAVELEYQLDTKGFYRPVYMFDTSINGLEYSIIIPAS